VSRTGLLGPTDEGAQKIAIKTSWYTMTVTAARPTAIGDWAVLPEGWLDTEQ